jgi:hypothetical protein
MRTLLIEREAGVGRTTHDRLVAEGHGVVRCGFDAGDGCAGMPGRAGCPLDVEPVDVAVDVRGPLGGTATEMEDGVRCAVRRGVPVTVVGPVDGASFEPWVTDVVGDDEALVPAIERAARRRWETLALPAGDAARHAMRDHASGGATVSLERDGHRLRAVVTTEGEVDEHIRQAIAVRVAGALRPRVPWATAIDVAVTPDR